MHGASGCWLDPALAGSSCSHTRSRASVDALTATATGAPACCSKCGMQPLQQHFLPCLPSLTVRRITFISSVPLARRQRTAWPHCCSALRASLSSDCIHLLTLCDNTAGTGQQVQACTCAAASRWRLFGARLDVHGKSKGSVACRCWGPAQAACQVPHQPVGRHQPMRQAMCHTSAASSAAYLICSWDREAAAQSDSVICGERGQRGHGAVDLLDNETEQGMLSWTAQSARWQGEPGC